METTLITISGAADPTAKKVAPATSSRIFHRAQSVSRAVAMYLSHTIASATKQYSTISTSSRMPYQRSSPRRLQSISTSVELDALQNVLICVWFTMTACVSSRGTQESLDAKPA